MIELACLKNIFSFLLFSYKSVNSPLIHAHSWIHQTLGFKKVHFK